MPSILLEAGDREERKAPVRKAPVPFLVKRGRGSGVLPQAVLSLKVPPVPQRQPQGSGSQPANLKGSGFPNSGKGTIWWLFAEVLLRLVTRSCWTLQPHGL